MAQDLPGYYFDAARNRYFPKSFRNQLRLEEVWSYRGLTGSADSAVEQFHANIQTCEGLRGANVLTWGGSNAFFGICEIVQPDVAKDRNYAYSPQRLFPSDESSVGTGRPPHLLLTSSLPISTSKVTAIKRLGKAVDLHHGGVLFTTLGSAGEGGAVYLLKQSQHQDGCWENGQHLPFNVVRSAVTDCSVWTTSCSGPATATLGTSKGAAMVDLERSSLTWLFHSRSDILSQQCDSSGNIVLCGFRNGRITSVDVRVPLPRPQRMLINQSPSKFPLYSWRKRNALMPRRIQKSSNLNSGHGLAKGNPRTKAEDETLSHFKPMHMGSAICSMVLLQSDETYLLASSMNGNIQLWDRRLVDKGPVLSYEGNYNTHSMLQLGLDPSESLLASGGEDHTIRIWSLRSGHLLQTISGLPSLAHTFSSPVELGNINIHGWSSSLDESSFDNDHAWGMWLGSPSELLYMHGAATGVNTTFASLRANQATII